LGKGNKATAGRREIEGSPAGKYCGRLAGKKEARRGKKRCGALKHSALYSGKTGKLTKKDNVRPSSGKERGIRFQVKGENVGWKWENRGVANTKNLRGWRTESGHLV